MSFKMMKFSLLWKTNKKHGYYNIKVDQCELQRVDKEENIGQLNLAKINPCVLTIAGLYELL